MKRTLGILMLSLLFSACNKLTDDDRVQLDLGACKSGRVGTKEVKICFDTVLEDTRCPYNAFCIWQGSAKVRLKFSAASEHVLELSTADLGSGYRKDTVVEGYHIALLSLDPHPGASGDTVAVVSVTR